MASEPTSGGRRRVLAERPGPLSPFLGGARSLLRLQEAGVLGALLMCAGLTLASPHFLAPNNLVVVLQQASNFGIKALGMVLRLADKVLVFYRGRTVATIARERLQREEILRLMNHGRLEEGARA